jgi:catechol 2,3-dioxygenase-like lactoylglutathione lyase family enzyme
MRVLGITFAGTATASRPEMAGFVTDVLGLARTELDGVEADLFAMPDGSMFAVASVGGMGSTERTLGFLVDDLDAAVVELRDAGIRTDPEISSNASQRYIHFRAPDGNLYELVEPLDP